MVNHKAVISLWLITIAAFFMIAGSPTAASAAAGKGPAIASSDGSLSINVENMDPTALFTDLSKEANLEVRGVDIIPRDSITVRFENLSVEEGIKVVMRAISVDNYAIFYRKGPDSSVVVSSIAFIGGDETIEATARSSSRSIKEPYAPPRPKSVNRARSKGIPSTTAKTNRSERTRRDPSRLSGRSGNTLNGNAKGEKRDSFRGHPFVNSLMNGDMGDQQKALKELMGNLDPEERAHMEEAIEPFFDHMGEIDPELGGRLSEMMEGLSFNE